MTKKSLKDFKYNVDYIFLYRWSEMTHMRKIITIIFITSMLLSVFGVSAKINNSPQSEKNIISNGETDYWALLVGCTEFDVAPIKPLVGNDRVVHELNDLLLVSENWQQDHIKILTGKNATKSNIINGLEWLGEKDDEDDICFFYMSSHGTQGRDVFPKDEKDGFDEYLLTYDSYRLFPLLMWCTFSWRELRDDEINKYLNLLDSKGVIVIIDSCFSGGFNDPPSNSHVYKKINSQLDKKISVETWINEFGEGLRGPGRVILMSGEENTVTQGLCFTYFAMEGMQGGSDTNNDSICSAEEIFSYADPLTTSWLKLYKNWVQHPQIYDDYPGELPITISELPPNPPDNPIGPTLGTVNSEYQYIIRAIDLENDNIRYHIDWDDGTQEITDFIESGESMNISHGWNQAGTYNIWLETEDEHHAMIYQFGMPKCFPVIICDNDNQVDQYQTKIYQPQGFYDCMICMFNNHWTCLQAQSFIPRYNILTKVDLWVGELADNMYPLKVAIRKNLSGADLTSVSNTVPMNDLEENIGEKWTTFDFPDIEVNPGETYYIICSHTARSIAQSFWFYGDPDYPAYPYPDEDPYPNGQAFKSEDGGLTWTVHNIYADDFCFVTYGKNSI